jgi:putative transposase
MRYGYRRLHILLQREGYVLGRDLAYRLYSEESLQLRSKRPRRRKMAVARRERYVPKRANQAWSMDFVADQLADGRKLRALTVVDVFTREALGIRVGQRLRGEDVVNACNQLVARAEPRFVCWSIMEASSLVVSCIFGHTTTACRLTLAVPANQPTTATSRHSTDLFAMSA